MNRISTILPLVQKRLGINLELIPNLQFASKDPVRNQPLKFLNSSADLTAREPKNLFVSYLHFLVLSHIRTGISLPFEVYELYETIVQLSKLQNKEALLILKIQGAKDNDLIKACREFYGEFFTYTQTGTLDLLNPAIYKAWHRAR